MLLKLNILQPKFSFLIWRWSSTYEFAILLLYTQLTQHFGQMVI